MSEAVMTETADGAVADFSADKQTFHVPWGKAMMWFSSSAIPLFSAVS